MTFGNPLFTDLYQINMLAGYFQHGMHEQQASFDLYFRRAPFHGAYAVFAGLGPALEHLAQLRFADEHLAYLKRIGNFDLRFLEYLKTWRFRARVEAVPEGRIVFANEPLLTVTGSLVDAQLVESALLNIVNFQTLVATKAARVCAAAGEAKVLEFGLRRAQGPNGAMGAARAAFIGGVAATSNVEAARVYGIPSSGTHAHAWVQAFDSELAAFRAYAAIFPDQTTLLIDTYDTLESGVENAIQVARELAARGSRLRGVRLDSGDLAYLSRRVRARLDEEGFTDVKIVASNDLDEFVIDSVRREGGRVDIWGVGTQLATAGGEGGGALGGVYKLVSVDGRPKLKLTADREKTSLPGEKQLWRVYDATSRAMLLDLIGLRKDVPRPGDAVFDPTNPLRHMRLPDLQMLEQLREVVMQDGEFATQPELEYLQERARMDLARLPEGSARLLNPHTYKVSMTEALYRLRDELIEQIEAGLRSPASSTIDRSV